MIFRVVCFALLLSAFCFCASAGNFSNSVPVQLSHSTAAVSQVAVPEPDLKALNHYHSGLVLMGLSFLWNLLILTLFAFTGFSAWMRSWASRLGRNWYFSFALYCVALGLVYFLAGMPVYYKAGFTHPHHYDLSSQTVGKWLGDYCKSGALTLVLCLAVGWVPLLLMKKSPRRWWLYSGLLMLPFLCFMCLIQPICIDPIFHKFEPLRDKALEAKILAEASRAGIEGGRVYQVNMSADTRTLNAYVNGFMGTQRIVFWDTTLKALDEDELLFVLGHEMGHYKLGHIYKIIAFETVLILLLFYLIDVLAKRVIAKFKTRLGFAALSDFAAIPLVFLVALIVVAAGMPLSTGFSRILEHDADRFGLELTHSNHAAATAFVKMAKVGLGVPRPNAIVQFWLGTHPCIADRIDFCNSYQPPETALLSR